jgi:hypothetical protein
MVDSITHLLILLILRMAGVGKASVAERARIRMILMDATSFDVTFKIRARGARPHRGPKPLMSPRKIIDRFGVYYGEL